MLIHEIAKICWSMITFAVHCIYRCAYINMSVYILEFYFLIYEYIPVIFYFITLEKYLCYTQRTYTCNYSIK